MGAGRGGPMAQLALLTLLALPGAGAVKVEHILIQADFSLRMERPQQESGQVMFEFDQDEVFHVDLDRTEAVWRLPDFGKFASVEAQGALGAIAADKQNLDTLMKMSNYTRAQNGTAQGPAPPCQRPPRESLPSRLTRDPPTSHRPRTSPHPTARPPQPWREPAASGGHGQSCQVAGVDPHSRVFCGFFPGQEVKILNCLGQHRTPGSAAHSASGPSPLCRGTVWPGAGRQAGRPVHTVPPEVTVFPKAHVELGEPNVLICLADKFSPPALSVTWLRNGEEVAEGVYETDFYPRPDFSFRKFSYLPFLPRQGDYYDCRVQHQGLAESFTKHWEAQAPTPVPETTETLVCALGLAVGIVGIIAGTILIIKGMKMNAARNPRGPL